jgi:demethylmenaquinone methyltransferase/2-methoxy-6-polyprenyl-1,4-benzoquinol methylase
VFQPRLLDSYRHEAEFYDKRTGVFHRWRRRLVDLLSLQSGDVVLDLGCGSGLCFPLLEAKIGPQGRIVGIDQSPEMLALARTRLVGEVWGNVTLVESSVERAEISVVADAALFCATHDILQSSEALDNVFGHLRHAGWVAAAGGKWAPLWAAAVNPLVWATHRPYVSSFEGFDRPWRHLARYVDDLRVEEVALGTGYLAVGRAGRSGVAR